MAEATVVLKQKDRLRGKGGVHSGPVDRVGEIDIEIRDHRAALLLHVRGGREIGLLDILQLADERLLRRAARA